MTGLMRQSRPAWEWAHRIDGGVGGPTTLVEPSLPVRGCRRCVSPPLVQRKKDVNDSEVGLRQRHFTEHLRCVRSRFYIQRNTLLERPVTRLFREQRC